MQNQMDKKKHCVNTVRTMIHDNALKEAHRIDEKAFTRDRMLTFSCLLIIMLRKSVKSLQLMLNEISDLLAFVTPVSNAAYCKARQKLKASVFVELNRKAVVEAMH